MQKSVAPIAHFRVYPGSQQRSGLYLTVVVFKTRAEMLTYCRESANAGYQCGDNVNAACHSFDRIVVRAGKKDRKLPHIGEIHLHLDAIGIGVLSHEMAHGAYCWLRRKLRTEGVRFFGKVIYDMTVEEKYAWVLGNLVRQSVVRLYELGIYPR